MFVSCPIAAPYCKTKEAVAKGVDVSEDALRNDIMELIDAGMDPEDAAVEAALNLHGLLGNGICGDGNDHDVRSVVSKDDTEQVVKTWCQHCFDSLRALKIRHNDLQMKTVGSDAELSILCGNIMGTNHMEGELDSGGNDGQDSEMSGTSVFFVNWAIAGIKGRPVQLDSENRVKCIVCVGALKDARDYRHAEVVHPSIGVNMARDRGRRGSQRPNVPAWALKLHAMWKASLLRTDSQSSGHLGGSSEPCSYCSDELIEIAVLCPLCLERLHPSCGRKVAALINDVGIEWPDDLDISDVFAGSTSTVFSFRPGPLPLFRCRETYNMSVLSVLIKLTYMICALCA